MTEEDELVTPAAETGAPAFFSAIRFSVCQILKIWLTRDRLMPARRSFAMRSISQLGGDFSVPLGYNFVDAVVLSKIASPILPSI